MKTSIAIIAVTISSLIQASHYQPGPSQRRIPSTYPQIASTAAPSPLDQAADPLKAPSWTVTSSDEPCQPSNEERIASLSLHVQQQQRCISWQARQLSEQYTHTKELEHQAWTQRGQISQLQQDVTTLFSLLRSSTQQVPR